MQAKTDLVLLALGLLFFFIGWRKGLLQILINPIAFFVCLVIGAVYFDLNQDFIKSGAIVIGGTLLLTVLLRLIFFLARRSVDKAYLRPAFFFSRLLGGVVNVTWKFALISAILPLISLVPLNLPKFDEVKKDIAQSRIIFIINNLILSRTPAAQNSFEIVETFNDPRLIEGVASSREYQEFMADPEIREVFTNPELIDELQNGNYQALLADPKVRAIFFDEKIRKKVTALGRKAVALHEHKKDPDETFP